MIKGYKLLEVDYTKYTDKIAVSDEFYNKYKEVLDTVLGDIIQYNVVGYDEPVQGYYTIKDIDEEHLKTLKIDYGKLIKDIDEDLKEIDYKGISTYEDFILELLQEEYKIKNIIEGIESNVGVTLNLCLKLESIRIKDIENIKNYLKEEGITYKITF